MKKKQAKQKPDKNSEPRATTVKRVENTEFDKMANGFLDTLQAEAAKYYEKLYLSTQMTGIGMNLENPVVDGGQVYVEIPDRVIDAHKKLGEALRHLGPASSAILHKFVCEGLTAKLVANQFGEDGDRAEKYYRRRFRDVCTELANFLWPAKTASSRRANYIRGVNSVVDPSYWKKDS